MPVLVEKSSFPSRHSQRLGKEKSFALDVHEATGAPRLTARSVRTAFLNDAPESRIGLLCHNDPIDNVDPMGLEINYAQTGPPTSVSHLATTIQAAIQQAKQIAAQIKQLQNVVHLMGYPGHGAIGIGMANFQIGQLQMALGQSLQMAQMTVQNNQQNRAPSQAHTEWNRLFVTSYHDEEDWQGRSLGPGSIAVANANLRSLQDDWRHTPVSLAYPEGTRMTVHFDTGRIYRGTVRDWGRGNLEPRPSLGLPHGVGPTQWIDVWTRRQIAEWASVEIIYAH